MDYGALVSKSLKIMWKFKYLWLLGFLAGIGEGAGQVFSNFNRRSHGVSDGLISKSIIPGLGHTSLIPDLTQAWVIFTIIACVLLLFVIFMILRYIAHGGLIHCVNKINQEQPTGLGEGWKTGLRCFWRLLGIGILVFFMLIAATVVCAAPVGIAFVIHKIMGLFALLLFIPIFIAILAVIFFIDGYADRACVIEGKGIIDSIREGWKVFRGNIGKSVMIGIISFFSSFVYFVLFVAIGLGLLANFFLAWIFAGLLVAIIFGVLIMFIYAVITEGIFETYLSAFWTLAYLDIKKLSQKNAVPPSDF